MPYFQALATDLDGTLTRNGEVADEVIAAIRAARAAGLHVVLATGRVLDDLDRTFPRLTTEFDAVVAENGAVIRCQGRERTLAPPVSADLADALRRRNVPVERGLVLVAMPARYERTVVEEVRRGGWELQLIRNRGALMVLPTGVSKGTGVIEALGDLGVSRHNTVGVGDAENDHSLLTVCEVGAAVDNAVESLKGMADLTLRRPGPTGVVELIERVLADDLSPVTARSRVSLSDDGDDLVLPASRVNVVMTGGTVAGKSFAAGLMAERLVMLGYTIVVLDLEGDHLALGGIRGLLLLTAGDVPSPAQLAHLVAHRYTSLVVDLSQHSAADKESYVREGIDALSRLRAERGLPHWLFVEEAHHAVHDEAVASQLLTEPFRGACLITYRPRALPPLVAANTDVVIAAPGLELEPGGTLDLLDSVADVDRQTLAAALSSVPPGQVLVYRRDRPGATYACTLGSRATTHVRHRRKYADGALPAGRGFYFTAGAGQPACGVATNISEFQAVLATCDAAVVLHHARNGDFSNWIGTTIQDATLAHTLLGAEARARDGSDAESIRAALLRSVTERYGATG